MSDLTLNDILSHLLHIYNDLRQRIFHENCAFGSPNSSAGTQHDGYPPAADRRMRLFGRVAGGSHGCEPPGEASATVSPGCSSRHTDYRHIAGGSHPCSTPATRSQSKLATFNRCQLCDSPDSRSNAISTAKVT